MDDLYTEIRRVIGERSAPFTFKAYDADNEFLTTLTWKGVEDLIARADWAITLEWSDVEPPGNLAVFGATDTLKLNITIDGVEQTQFDPALMSRKLQQAHGLHGMPRRDVLSTKAGGQENRDITEAVHLENVKEEKAQVGPMVFGHNPTAGYKGDRVVGTVSDFRHKRWKRNKG